MKHILLFSSLIISSCVLGQQSTNTWDFEGVTRKYIQYIPSSYDGNTAVPLVIALHGLGDNVNNFSNVGFQAVADTANFIVIYPEALEYVDPILGSFGNAWNSGAGSFGIYPNADINDVGFLNAVMDTVSDQLNIDQERIFVTGFSMGGFMTNRLACELNDRVAAIASVAGTIGSGITCDPGGTIPTCHFHGTFDTNVGYGVDGGGTQDNTFGLNTLDWIDYWNTNNGCGNLTLEGAFPNTASDGFDVEYYEYGLTLIYRGSI